MHLLAHRLYDVSQPLEFTKCKEFDVAAVAKEKSGNLGETGETRETVSLAGSASIMTEVS